MMSHILEASGPDRDGARLIMNLAVLAVPKGSVGKSV